MAEPIDAPEIVWDTVSLCVDNSDQHGEWADTSSVRRTVGLPASTVGSLVARLSGWFRRFGRSLSEQQRCDGPMETTRRVATSLDQATAVLGVIRSVDWTSKSGVGHLDLGRFRSTPGEPGRPWVASAVLHERRTRRLNVSVAIFTWGSDRCGITIRPNYRRPWSRRRLRRCLRSTHSAADRLREIVLAPDFRPIT